MNRLITSIEKDLPQGMYLPEEFKKLFEWMDENNLIFSTDYYEVAGSLKDLTIEDTLKSNEGQWITYNGTTILFYPQNALNKDTYLEIYGEKAKQLYLFAKSGGDGSHVAFWLNEKGDQKIVHLGSGSGSILFCVISETPLDFLRLLSVGYDELCLLDSEEVHTKVPNTTNHKEDIVLPNIKYQKWVEETFDTTIPQTASEIFISSTMDDDSSTDEFWNWDKKYSKLW